LVHQQLPEPLVQQLELVQEQLLELVLEHKQLAQQQARRG
jgi:hypothetical protein